MSKNLNGLTKKISLQEIPKKCQEILPYIAEQYFNGKSRESLKFELSRKCKKYVDLMYDRLENSIKTNSLEKMKGIIVGHPNDFKDDVVFADAIMRYCIEFSDHGLKKEAFKVFKSLDKENRNHLNRRYKTGEKMIEDRYALKALVKTKEFRGLVRDKFILNKK